jgi:hypothetical protein
MRGQSSPGWRANAGVALSGLDGLNTNCAKMWHCEENAWNCNEFFTVLAQILVPRGRQVTMRLAAFVVLAILSSSTVVSSTDSTPSRAIARTVDNHPGREPMRLLVLVTSDRDTLGGAALVQ